MATGQLGAVVRHIRRLALARAATSLADGQLLQRFTAHGDEAAFAALIQRHGGLVLRVCRNRLRHEQDAEDAFQATFLVLARKACAIAHREKLAGWLHKTAYHCAMQIKRAAARRRVHERQASAMPQSTPTDEAAWRELQAILDEEVARLAEKYRAPFVLCCLEGKSKAEAAQELGWKEGTVSGRLAQARKQLQQRLTRRGVTLSTVLCATALSHRTIAAIPATLATSTLKAAIVHGAGTGGSCGLIAAEVAAVVGRVIKTMFLTKLKATLSAFLTVSLVASGTSVLAYRTLAVRQKTSANHDMEFTVANGIPRPKKDQELPESNEKRKAAAEPAKTEDAWEKEVSDLPKPEQAEDFSSDSEHRAVLAQHLRDIHAAFPHLAAMHEHLRQIHSGLPDHAQALASHSPAPTTAEAAGTPAVVPVAVGQRVPDFTVTDLDGKKLTLSELRKDLQRGKKGVVVLSLWCSFCGSCRRVEHQLDRLARDYQGKAAVVAIDASAGETAAKVRAFAEKKGLAVPIFLDPRGHMADLFGTNVTTTSVVIDGDGVLRYCGQFSAGSHSYVEEALRAVLAGKEVPIPTTPYEG